MTARYLRPIGCACILLSSACASEHVSLGGGDRESRPALDVTTTTPASTPTDAAVTVAVVREGRRVAGVPVYFHDAEGRLTASHETDEHGVVTAVSAPAQLSVVDRDSVPGAHAPVPSVVTFTRVEAGDRLLVELASSRAWLGDHDYQVATPTLPPGQYADRPTSGAPCRPTHDVLPEDFELLYPNCKTASEPQALLSPIWGPTSLGRSLVAFATKRGLAPSATTPSIALDVAPPVAVAVTTTPSVAPGESDHYQTGAVPISGGRVFRTAVDDRSVDGFPLVPPAPFTDAALAYATSREIDGPPDAPSCALGSSPGAHGFIRHIVQRGSLEGPNVIALDEGLPRVEADVPVVDARGGPVLGWRIGTRHADAVDGFIAVLGWRSGSWSFVAPPDAVGVRAPELPPGVFSEASSFGASMAGVEAGRILPLTLRVTAVADSRLDGFKQLLHLPVRPAETPSFDAWAPLEGGDHLRLSIGTLGCGTSL